MTAGYRIHENEAVARGSGVIGISKSFVRCLSGWQGPFMFSPTLPYHTCVSLNHLSSSAMDVSHHIDTTLPEFTTVETPPTTPTLLPEIIRLIARLAHPELSRKLKRLNAHMLFLITKKDLLAGEDLWRRANHPSKEYIVWAARNGLAGLLSTFYATIDRHVLLHGPLKI